jgi:ferrous iron transport protein B
MSVPACHDLSEINPKKHSDTPLITLIGQPNSGKTTLFNVLTGSNFKTSNYAGTTVEFSLGKLNSKYGYDYSILDVPGITSLYSKSPDEEISINVLFEQAMYQRPDVVIVTVDSSQLSRHLYLARQIKNSGFNVILALTMNDLLEKKGLEISAEKLEGLFECPVVKINARKAEGVDALVHRITQALANTIFDARHKITKPDSPTEASVMQLYRLTEDMEKRVIGRRHGELDIEKVNRDFFNFNNPKPDKFSLQLDKFILHPFWGMVIFFVSMGLIFTSIFWIAKPLMDSISFGFGLLSEAAASLFPGDVWYGNLLSEGIIKGVGTVFTFLPQIVILFLYLGILEDTGYLSRAAMLIDKPLSKIGLNGRSFVPMLSGFACAIPAMMAARTISNRRERLLTIFIIPLMTCSARLPIYALLLAFLTPPDQPWIAGISLGGIYLLSLINGAIAAGVVSKFVRRKEISSFMLELPAYRKPVLKFIWKNTYYKSVTYVKKAGPIIIFCSLIIWTLTFFPDIHPKIDAEKTKHLNEHQMAKMIESERISHSFAASVGHLLDPVFIPIGWDWRVGVGLVSAFVAREVFVSSMALTFSVADDNTDNIQISLLGSMREAKLSGTEKPLFTPTSVIGLIIFFMFAMQCASTLAVSRKETGSWKIPILQQILYTGGAYLLALIAVIGLKALGMN